MTTHPTTHPTGLRRRARPRSRARGLDARARRCSTAPTSSTPGGPGGPVADGGGRRAGSRLWDHVGAAGSTSPASWSTSTSPHSTPRSWPRSRSRPRPSRRWPPSTAALVRGEAARRITERAPAGLDTVFFTNGGADAVENTRSAWRACTHGRDKGRLDLPLLPREHRRRGRRDRRLEAGAQRVRPRATCTSSGPTSTAASSGPPRPRRVAERALQHLRRVVESEGPSGIAAVLLETVPGPPACWCPTAGYLAGVRALCDRHGIVMIIDEVMAGFGRTGEWFASTTRRRARPDHLRQGRQLRLRAGRRRRDRRGGRGLLRRARLPGRADLLRPTRWPAASIVAALDAMAEVGIVDHARRIGTDVLGPGLAALAERHRVVGRGARRRRLLGPRARRRPRHPRAADGGELARAKSELLARGLLPLLADNRIHVVPPCVVTDDEVAEALEAYDAVLTLLDEE